MPLQNRVDPFGAIHAEAGRGLFTGNRGVIHDPATRTLLARRWTSRAWLICRCDYPGRRREVMGRNTASGGAGWTELFFLDEPTALAASHRPCFFCRRERARDFLGRFGDVFGIAEPKVAELDARLHVERGASGGPPVGLEAGELALLPDGAMVARDGEAFAVRGGRVMAWTFSGYGRSRSFEALAGAPLRMLTPATTLAILGAGYAPAWHGSASSAEDAIA